MGKRDDDDDDDDDDSDEGGGGNEGRVDGATSASAAARAGKAKHATSTILPSSSSSIAPWSGFDALAFRHIAREYNTVADALSNVAMDTKKGGVDIYGSPATVEIAEWGPRFTPSSVPDLRVA